MENSLIHKCVVSTLEQRFFKIHSVVLKMEHVDFTVVTFSPFLYSLCTKIPL
jgi:hypothetical protein